MKKVYEELVLVCKMVKVIVGFIFIFWNKVNKVCFEICCFFINLDGV